MDLVDLHTHSTVSDGTLTPKALIQYAKEKRLKAVALTDHDNIDGNEQAMEEGRRVGIEVIPGVEISGEWPHGTLHILGYYITKKTKSQNHLSQLQRVREQRNLKIIEKLKQSGIPITFEEVLDEAGGTQIGRPHIAQVLVKKGVVKGLDQAFHRFLKKGGPAYVNKFRPTPEQAMEWILEAEGVPVLAHPFTLYIKKSKDLEIIMTKWKGFGLKGIEVYYPEHTPSQEQMYQNLAQRLELVITGGSDFHGLNKPDVDLGTGYGDMKVPYACVESLKKCRDDTRKKTTQTG